MKKLAAACVTAFLAGAIALVVTLGGGTAHKPAPTAGSSWATLPGISLGSLGSLLGL
ncbi:MAG TPA: hypothetical protein VHZ96_22290 [Frankiaceae bacterium]|jgi:hypothetical protein|nr:hypothetical protein [Frankiaceae bacterium]